MSDKNSKSVFDLKDKKSVHDLLCNKFPLANFHPTSSLMAGVKDGMAFRVFTDSRFDDGNGIVTELWDNYTLNKTLSDFCSKMKFDIKIKNNIVFVVV